MNLSLGEVAAYVDSTCGEPDRVVQGYSIDSRSLGPGQLFFAIRGPRFDGHQFATSAVESGAAGAVVNQDFFAAAPSELMPLMLPVADTREALQTLGRAVRRRWGKKVVAITGSAGKSTTKEMLAAILSRRLRVMRSPGNLNNDYGVPLALLELDTEHEVAVVELGMSASGEIARLARIAEPQIGVVTNVAAAHLQFFDSIEAIARAKRELIDYLAATGPESVAVLNADDERVRAFGRDFPGRVITYGFSPGATFQAASTTPGPQRGNVFGVTAPEWGATFSLPLPGRHNVQNAVAAIAAASTFDIPPAAIQQALADFQNLHQRSEIITLPGGVTVINDCYNANPLAMARMLEMLADWPEARRRVVVAGEMLELGPLSPELHQEVGRQAARCGVERVIGVQGDARFLVEEFQAQHVPGSQGAFFPESRAAGAFARSLIAPGDVVLVKGSRGVHLETVIEMLRAWEVSTPPPEV